MKKKPFAHRVTGCVSGAKNRKRKKDALRHAISEEGMGKVSRKAA